MRLDRLHLCAASLLALGFVAWGVGAVDDLTFVPPDAANYGVIARNLLRGDGYTESLVPYHPVAYASVRHLPENHALLRPFLLVPLFALLGVRPLPLRIPGLVYTAATAVLVFWWTRRAFGIAAAWVAFALTLLSANLFVASFFGTDDTGFAFFFTATTAFLCVGVSEKNERYLLIAGVTSGLAVLEKAVGLMMPALFVVPAFRVFDLGVRRAGRWLALVAGPFVLAVSVYAVRNRLAHGGVDFRMTPLYWILRVDGYEGVNRLFTEPPSLAGALRLIGWSRLATIVANDVRMFAASVFRLRPLTDASGVLMAPAFLPTVALVGIPLYARRAPAMVALFAASLLGSVAFVCGLWHFELRYFVMLVPLFAVWTAGVLAFAARAGRVARWATATAAVAIVVATAVGLVRMEKLLPVFSAFDPCPRALAWIAREIGPADRLLTLDPWYAAWATDRETVMIPSGGVDAIAEVARRYDTHWLLAYPWSTRPETSATIMALATVPRADGLRVATRYDRDGCRVYRLDWVRADR